MASSGTMIRQAQYGGWFVDTPSGPIGPLDSEHEAKELMALLEIANAARDEFGCTEAECGA